MKTEEEKNTAPLLFYWAPPRKVEGFGRENQGRPEKRDQGGSFRGVFSFYLRYGPGGGLVGGGTGTGPAGERGGAPPHLRSSLSGL